MNKRGFTLIELLAVIVILAIIALIATPIVLSIINQSKESAQIRSAEMYKKGLETSVATATLNEQNIPDGTYKIVSGNVCLGTVEGTGKDRTCKGDTLKVEMNGEVPDSGTVTIENGKVKDIYFTYLNGKTIVKENNKLVFEGSEDGSSSVTKKTLDTICTYQNNGVPAKTAGAKYSCKVKEGTNYNFYVLTTPTDGSETINLIMDSDICEDGTLSTENNKCTVAWLSIDDYKNNNGPNIAQFTDGGPCQYGNSCNINELGPITAMNFLHNATKDWINIEPISYQYMDRATQGITGSNKGYTSFISNNGVATIYSLEGVGAVIGSETEPLRARMPIFSNDTTKTEVANSNGSNTYLYENIFSGTIYGYWTLSSYNSSLCALFLGKNGKVNFDSDVSSNSTNGVRPVITLKL